MAMHPELARLKARMMRNERARLKCYKELETLYKSLGGEDILPIEILFTTSWQDYINEHGTTENKQEASRLVKNARIYYARHNEAKSLYEWGLRHQ